MSLKGKAAIVGYGCTKPQRHAPRVTVSGLMAEAAAKAIGDAGLRKEDIDGLLTHADGVDLRDWCSVLAEYVQIRPTMASTPGILGVNGAGMVWRAAAAIDAGLCNYVLCVGESAKEVAGRARAVAAAARLPSAGSQFEAPYGPSGAPSGYALVAQRHAYEYGTTDAQRARVAVDQRFNACANPYCHLLWAADNGGGRT